MASKSRSKPDDSKSDAPKPSTVSDLSPDLQSLLKDIQQRIITNEARFEAQIQDLRDLVRTLSNTVAALIDPKSSPLNVANATSATQLSAAQSPASNLPATIATDHGTPPTPNPPSKRFRIFKAEPKLAASGANFVTWRARLLSHFTSEGISWPPASQPEVHAARESIFASVDPTLLSKTETDPVRLLADLDATFTLDSDQATATAYTMLHNLRRVASVNAIRGLLDRTDEIIRIGNLPNSDSPTITKLLHCLPTEWMPAIEIWRTQRPNYTGLRQHILRKLRDEELTPPPAPVPDPPVSAQHLQNRSRYAHMYDHRRDAHDRRRHRGHDRDHRHRDDDRGRSRRHTVTSRSRSPSRSCSRSRSRSGSRSPTRDRAPGPSGQPPAHRTHRAPQDNGRPVRTDYGRRYPDSSNRSNRYDDASRRRDDRERKEAPSPRPPNASIAATADDSRPIRF